MFLYLISANFRSVVELRLVLTFTEETFSSKMYESNSSTFINLAKKIEQSFRNAFDASPFTMSLERVKVHQFS